MSSREGDRASSPELGAAFADGDGLAIVVNPSAGSNRDDDPVEALRAGLPRAAIVNVGEAETIERALDRTNGARSVGIVGGDGSINAAAERAVSTGRPLAVFPGGTLNHFARDIGVAGAAEAIGAVQRGDVMTVDVGVVDGKPFLNTASFGSYAELVDEREKHLALGKWLAMLIAAIQVLRRAAPVRVELDGEPRRIWMIFIGNCEYQPSGFAPMSRERLDDGLFDVRYLDGSARWSRLRFLGALATGNLARSKVYTRRLVRSLDIHSVDGPLRLARDGETFDGGADVRIAKHSRRLAVYAPVDSSR